MIAGKTSFDKSIVQKFCVLYLCVWSVSPPLSIGMPFRLLALASAAIWFLIAIFRGFVFDKQDKSAIGFAVLVALVAIIQFAGFSKILAQISMFMLVIAFLMFRFYTDRWHELGNIHVIILLLLILWNFKTFTALIADPTIARLIVRDDELTYEYLRQGVGGYALIYGQVCVFPLIISWIFAQFKKNKFFFIIGCVWLVTYMMTIFSAGYSIAIACTFISFIVLFVVKSDNIVPTIVVCVALFAFALVLIRYSEGFRGFLLEKFDGTAVAKKINDFMAGETGKEENSIAVRIDAYKSNFIMLFKYPIIGGLWWEDGNGHSAIMSTFAKYGWFGGYEFCKMIFSMPNYYRKRKTNNRRLVKVVNAVFASILFVCFLDAAPYEMIFMIVIMSSIFYRDISEEKNYENFVDSKFSAGNHI